MNDKKAGTETPALRSSARLAEEQTSAQPGNVPLSGLGGIGSRLHFRNRASILPIPKDVNSGNNDGIFGNSGMSVRMNGDLLSDASPAMIASPKASTRHSLPLPLPASPTMISPVNSRARRQSTATPGTPIVQLDVEY